MQLELDPETLAWAAKARRFADEELKRWEVEAEMNERGAGARFDESFEAAQRAAGNLHAGAGRDFGSEDYFKAGFEAEQDVAKLVLERFLIGNVEEIGDVIALENFLPLRRLQDEAVL